MKQLTSVINKIAIHKSLSSREPLSQDHEFLGTEQKLFEETSTNSVYRKLPKTSSNATVMVIDDELSILDLFKKFFKLDGVCVQGFSNPRQAADWYQEHWQHIKLVFLDMKNPKMSGEDCFCILQGINPGAHIALISSNVETEIVDELMHKGALCLFSKPFHYPSLITWALRRLGLPVKTTPAVLPV